MRGGFEAIQNIGQAVLALEAEWKVGRRPSLSAFLQDIPQSQRRELGLALVCVELQTRIKIGEFARIEHYLVDFSEFRDDQDCLLELIEAECTARIARGELADWVGDYRQRFPLVSDRIGWRRVLKWGSRKRPDEDPIPSLPYRLGRFYLKSEIGRGSSSVVYAARENAERGVSTVAVKIPLGGIEALDQDIRQLLRKSQYANLLDHPGIVRVIEAGVDAETMLPYVAYPYYRGVSLESQLILGRTFSAEQACDYVAELAEIAAAAHAKNVVHRDLKPANILPNENGKPMLTDFGLATRAEGLTTMTGREFPEPLGTPAYMAPEQLRGDVLVNKAMDIYALGVILYRLLTRHLPFEGCYDVVYQNVMATPPIPPSRYGTGISPQLDRICLKALEKEPKRRHGTAQELADELKAERARLLKAAEAQSGR